MNRIDNVEQLTKALGDSLSTGSYEDRYRRPKNEQADSETERVRELLAAGASVESPEMMVNCCAFRSLGVVQQMVAAGANVNATTKRGGTPLMACGDSHQITRLLLSHKADPFLVDSRGRNALHYASGRFCNSSPVVRLLLRAGIDIDSRDHDGVTPLMLACRTNRTDSIVSLLEKGADIDAVDGKGDSVEDHARKGGYLYPLCELKAWRGLSGPSADANTKNTEGQTPLMSAPVDRRTVDYLLQRGADVRSKDQLGMTPLMYHVAECYSDKKIVETLIVAGSELEARDKFGMTPLLHSAKSGSREIFFGLVKLGADIDATDNDGCGVLEHSERSNKGRLFYYIKDYLKR